MITHDEVIAQMAEFTLPSYAEEYGIKVGEKLKLKIYDGLEFIEKNLLLKLYVM